MGEEQGLSAELKPCPFCGGELTITKHFRDPLWRGLHRCKIVGAISFEWSGVPNKIAADWNTRSEGLHPPVGVEDEVFSSLGASKAPSSASAGVAETPSGGWQDIASAPKDGTPILAWCVHPNARYAGEDASEWTEIVLTRWIDFNGGGWTWNGLCGVHTHWCPIPAPPTDCQTSGGEA